MSKKKWLTVALINLFVLATFGTILRCKILFSIPWIDFKNTLEAHSHFAFGGWITLCLFTLMTYEILPERLHSRPIYKWMLTSTFLLAVGMLVTFPVTGYAFLSILFSTLFIVSTYVFTWVFTRDLVSARKSKSITLLSTVALLSLVASSAGPYTLAYILATHSSNTMLYRDSIYTYLHLQYNGFFTVGVFAIFFNYIEGNVTEVGKRNLSRFALALSASVLPTMFLSYLWHYDSVIVRIIALAGCVCLAITLVLFFIMMGSAKIVTRTLTPVAKAIGWLSMLAFVLKTAIQAGIIIPAIGNAVFGDRPIIIGYLHLVLLGFVTLYLLAHIYQSGFFNGRTGITKIGVTVFASGVIINEVILMVQGLSIMVMINSAAYPYLLLGAAVWMLTGTLLISVPAIRNLRAVH